jgi:hypothetical protein
VFGIEVIIGKVVLGIMGIIVGCGFVGDVFSVERGREKEMVGLWKPEKLEWQMGGSKRRKTSGKAVSRRNGGCRKTSLGVGGGDGWSKEKVG